MDAYNRHQANELDLLDSFGIRARRIEAPYPIWLLGPFAPAEPVLRQCLSNEEIQRAARFRDDRLRDRYLSVHGALRLLGEACFGIPANRQTYARSPLGKPQMQQLPRAQCSISYSEDRAAVAWTSGPEIGIDLEVLRHTVDAQDLANTFFAQRERAALAKLEPSSAEFARSFLTVWVRKEACSKALGMGLSIDPTSFECGAGTARTTIGIDGQAVTSEVLDIEGVLLCWAQADRSAS